MKTNKHSFKVMFSILAFALHRVNNRFRAVIAKSKCQAFSQHGIALCV